MNKTPSKIAIVVDKKTSAIDRLSEMIRDNLSHLDITIYPFHPKRPDAEQISAVQKGFKECDLLHVAYWKSGEKLKEFINPQEFEDKPKLLCHYNPYDIHEEEVNRQYDAVIVGNQTIRNDLPSARLINYAVDLDFFKFFEEHPLHRGYEDNHIPVVNMVVGRIESNKGVLPVAKACKELGYKFLLVGRISSGDYFNEIMKVNPQTDFRENVSDVELRRAYYESDLHVCNSKDKFESGTLPLLEAMACGIPVMTRNIGHVPDLISNDGQNMYINEGEHDDVETLKENLKMLMDNTLLRKKMREKGWDTVRNWGANRMAWKFEKTYWDVIKQGDNQPTVSIVIPLRDEYEVLAQSLPKAVAQDYPYKEIVVVDSSDNRIDFQKVLEMLPDDNLPVIKYVHFEAKEGEYSLAKARNLGVLHASGQLMVFSDVRIGMEPSAVSAFVNRWTPQHWLWGMKDDSKKGFVENFSCVSRDELVHNGMFNQTICGRYGCMTQEIRQRLSERSWSPMTFQFVSQARAKGLARASSKASRREDIRASKDKLFKLYSV